MRESKAVYSDIIVNGNKEYPCISFLLLSFPDTANGRVRIFFRKKKKKN